MNIVDRFSTHVHETLGQAIKMSTDLKNREVEPLHLFFVLSDKTGSIAYEILKQAKIKPELILKKIENLPKENTGTSNNKIPQQALLAPLSDGIKNTIERAMMLAYDFEHNFVGTEHLLYALLEINDKKIIEIIKEQKINIENLKKQAENALKNSGQLEQISKATEMAGQIGQDIAGDFTSNPKEEIEPKTNNPKIKKMSALSFFATELTSKNNQKNIDDLIGRENEMERLEQILYRRTKNNPILLGEPGVGKTAIIEGLAKKIARHEVPDALKNKKIYSLDMGLLLAGTIYRGEFESRLKQVVEEATLNPDIILFIDEIHNIVGAGSGQGAMDAGNILKPALARGLLRCIGATTPGEYKKHIESDPALERRFQPIYIKEPSADETVKILTGLREVYEKYHNVKITDEAILGAVELSGKYIHNQFFPDKAVDVLDETAAAIRLTQGASIVEKNYYELKNKLEEITAKKDTAAKSRDIDLTAKLRNEEKKIETQLFATQKKLKTEKRPTITLGINDIARQVSKITGLKITEILQNPQGEEEKLENTLKEKIVGQDDVIKQIVKTVARAKLGITSENRPLASFIFIGENDTGKTETAKELARALYPQTDALIKLNMSEYNEGFSVSKLLGSPAGYVGYKEINQFTDKLKLNPHCVVLFDEIDKAHKDIMRLILQILDTGEITDATGRKISFKHAIIVMTTNVAAEELKIGGFGFGTIKSNNINETNKDVAEKLKNHFPNEMINRIDQICLFKKLSKLDLLKTIDIEIQNLNNVLKKHHTKIILAKPATEYLLGENSKKLSVRELRKNVRRQIEELISNIIVKGKVKPLYQIILQKNELNIKPYAPRAGTKQ